MSEVVGRSKRSALRRVSNGAMRFAYCALRAAMIAMFSGPEKDGSALPSESTAKRQIAAANVEFVTAAQAVRRLRS